MSHFLPIRTLTEEGPGNENMDAASGGLSIAPQVDGCVPVPVGLPVHEDRTAVVLAALEAAHAALA
jgi:hypothetical protein